MKNKHLKRFFLTGFCLILAAAGPVRGSIKTVRAAEEMNEMPASASVSISASDTFFDAKTKTLSVNFSAPSGTKANLIAAAFDSRDGSVKETVFKSVEGSGTVSFDFSQTALLFKVFAVNPDTLAPIAQNLVKTREYTTDDMDSESLEMELSLLSDKTAKALGAVVADYLKAQNALKALSVLTTEKTTVTRVRTVSLDEAMEGKEIVSSNTVILSSEPLSSNEVSGNEAENGEIIIISGNVASEEHKSIDWDGAVNDMDKEYDVELTRFDAIYNDENALADALSLLEAANAAYTHIKTSSAVLEKLSKTGKNLASGTGQTNGGTSRAQKLGSGYDPVSCYESMEEFAGQACMDAVEAIEALGCIDSVINGKYGDDELTAEDLNDYLSQIAADSRVKTGAGAANLTDHAILAEGTDLVLKVTPDGSMAVLEPGNGKNFEDARMDTDAAGNVFAYVNSGNAPKAGFLGEISGNDINVTAFDRYMITKAGDSLKAQVTELCRSDLSGTSLINEAVLYCNISGLGEQLSWTDVKDSFISGNSLSDEELSALLDNAYVPDLLGESFGREKASDYHESLGLTDIERSYTDADGHYWEEYYTRNEKSQYVGYHTKYRDGYKAMEEYYSTDRKAGLNGLIYQKYWNYNTHTLSMEVTYSSSVDIPLNAGAAGSADEEGTAEEPAGEIPKNDGARLFRKTRTYDEGYGYSVRVEQWRQDFFEEYCEKNNTNELDGEAERHGWFELLSRYYAHNGQLIHETMVMAGNGVNTDYFLRNRYYTERGERQREKWHYWDAQQMTFIYESGEDYQWYTSDELEYKPFDTIPEPLRSQIPGKLWYHVGSVAQKDEYNYEARVVCWNVERDEEGNPIPGTIVRSSQQNRPIYKEYGDDSLLPDGSMLSFDEANFDCVGWKIEELGKNEGGGYSVVYKTEFKPVIIHYRDLKQD